MAKNGTIYGSTSNQYIDAKIEYSYTQDYDANTSTITATLYFRRNNTGYTTSGTGTFNIALDGNVSTITKYMNIGTGWANAGSATRTVSHNSSGARSVSISATGGMPSTTLTSSSCSGTVTLDPIPRASTITTIANKSLGNSCIVAWTPLSKSFRYKLQFSLKGWLHTTDVIHPNQTTAYNYILNPLPLEVANQFSADSKEGTLEVRLFTYSDSAATTQVGSTSKKTFTVTLPDNASTKPTVTMSLAPVHSLSSKFASVYVQGKSRVKADIEGEGKYGASIVSYGMTVLGKGYASPFQSEPLPQSGTVTVYGRAKDSRGFVKEVSQDISVIPYNKPKLIPYSGNESIVCARCKADGTLSKSGEYLKIKVGRDYSKMMSGDTQKNFCLLRYRFKAASASDFSNYYTLLEKSASTDYVDVTLGGVVPSVTTSYVVELSVIDDVGDSSPLTFVVPTAEVTFHMREGGGAAAFGKYAEDAKVLDIAPDWDIRFKGDKIEKKFYSLRGNATIPNGSDLNNYLSPDVYAIDTDTGAETIANMPPFKKSGLLFVYAGTGQETVTEGNWKYIIQEYKSLYTTIPTYRRMINSDAEGVWTYGVWQMQKGLDTGWVELTKSGNASTPTIVTRGGAGCFYRVINENHVFVRFNCAFKYSGKSVNLNSETIPVGYRPKNNAYALMPVADNNTDRAIARVSVASDGYIYVNYVQNMASASTTTSFEATWIDGYIDYWI